MSSIRGRLLAILLLATGVIWLSAALWTQVSTRAQVIQVLDRRLEESARMVASLIREGGLSVDQAAQAARMERADADGFHLLHPLSCQIWGLDGTLISESAGAPEGRLSEAGGGFSLADADLSADAVLAIIEPLLGDADARALAAAAARSVGRPDAAATVAAIIIETGKIDVREFALSELMRAKLKIRP